MKTLVAYFGLDTWAQPIARQYPGLSYFGGVACCAFSVFTILVNLMVVAVGQADAGTLVRVILPALAFLFSYALAAEGKAVLRRMPAKTD
jgi:hypothetical protein